MTELEYKIQTLESAIRTVSRSIARSKNSRQKAADVATLARLQKELEELKLLAAHDQAVKENNEVWAELEACIAAASPSWEGVDPQEFMDMVRGREPQNETDE